MSDGDIADIVGDDFNADDHQPEKGNYELLPVAWYDCMINDAVVKENAKKTGFYLKLTLTIIDGNFKGRKIFPKITLKNPNETSDRIGKEQLAALAVALGLPSIKDTSLLKDKVVACKVFVTKPENGFEADNDVKTYKAAEGYAKAPTETKPKPKAEPKAEAKAEGKPAPKGKMPWQK